MKKILHPLSIIGLISVGLPLLAMAQSKGTLTLSRSTGTGDLYAELCLPGVDTSSKAKFALSANGITKEIAFSPNGCVTGGYLSSSILSDSRLFIHYKMLNDSKVYIENATIPARGSKVVHPVTNFSSGAAKPPMTPPGLAPINPPSSKPPMNPPGLAPVNPTPSKPPMTPPGLAPVNPPSSKPPMTPPGLAPLNPTPSKPVTPPPTKPPMTPPGLAPINPPSTKPPVNPPNIAPVNPIPSRPTNPTYPTPYTPPSRPPVNPPNIAPVNPNPAPVDRREIVSTATIQQRARESAMRYIRAVVTSVGQMEKIRRNIHLGFRQAEQVVQSLSPDIKQSQAYMGGYNLQSDQALYAGRLAGQKVALAKANQLALNEFYRAVDQAATNEVQPEFNPEVNVAEALNAYAGEQDPNRAKPADMESRLRAEDKRLQNALLPHYIKDDSILMPEDLISALFGIYEVDTYALYRQHLVFGPDRAERAFEYWKQAKLRTVSDNSNVQFYNKIMDDSRVQNAYQNESTFRSTFMQAYENSIVELWNQEVLKEVPQLREKGNELYIQVYNQRAHDLGMYDRYQADFAAGSRQEFSQQLTPAYQSSLVRLVEQSRASALVTAEKARLSWKLASNHSPSIGDQFSVILENAINKGQQEGHIQVVVTGDLKATNQASLSLAGYTKLKASQNFNNMAVLEDVTSPDQVIRATVMVNEEKFPIEFTSTFEALVAKSISSDDVASAEKAGKRMIEFLTAEWQRVSQEYKNHYHDRQGTLLLERFLKVYKGMNSADQQSLKRYKQAVWNTIENGRRPGGGFFGPGRSDDFDSAQKLIRESGFMN